MLAAAAAENHKRVLSRVDVDVGGKVVFGQHGTSHDIGYQKERRRSISK